MTISSPPADRVPLLLPFPLTPDAARDVRRSQLAASAELRTDTEQRLIASIERVSHDGVTVMTITPRSSSPAADTPDIGAGTTAGSVIYIHGGAYVIGSPVDMAAMLLADALGRPVHSIEYSLSPEARFPVALDECVTAYRSISRMHGERIALIGVSAGATLAASTALRLRDEGLPQPAALALATPWADLDRIGDSYLSNEGRDPVLTWNGLLDVAAAAYAGETPYTDPLLSPVYADFTADFAPSLIMTGTRDLFLSNCVRLHTALTHAGATSELRVWEGMWHAFLSDPGLPEARECREHLAAFINARLV